MLAVDRDQRASPALARRQRELARGDEALLVRERERDAVLERPHRRGQPGEAERRVEDDVGLGALEQLGRVAADLRQRREAVDRRRAGGGGDELERGVAAITSTAWRPIDPVAPRSATRVMGTVCPRHTQRVRLLVLACALGGRRRRLSPAAAGTSVEGVPRLGPVFVLIGENTDYQHLDATDSPYMMTNLRPRSAWFSNYYAATHWSQANYIALTSGRFTDCEQADKGYACRDDVDNVFHQLELARRSWHVWLEAGTAKCDTGSGGSCTSNDPCPLTGFYTTGNPPINYTNISYCRIASRTTSLQATRADGMSTFNSALARGDVADFNMVIPNGCEDGEANCKPLNNKHLQFDTFLRREIPLIEASPAFGSERSDRRHLRRGPANGRARSEERPRLGRSHDLLRPVTARGAGRLRREDVLVQPPPHAAGRARALAVPW